MHVAVPGLRRRPLRAGILAAAAGAMLLLAATPVYALQPPAPDVGQGGWWMGLGYLRYQRPYVGTSRWNRILPFFDIDRPHFFVHGLSAGWRAWHSGNNAVSLVEHPDALHYNAASNDALTGMTTKLATVMGGPAWTWRFVPHLSLETEALADLLRRNDGAILDVALAGRWRAGAWSFQPRLTLEWQSANYVDYYYGVTTAEARPGRPAYSGKSTLNEALGFEVNRTLGSHFAATLGAYETRYGSGITSSPIVARSDALSLLLALYYRF